MEKNTKHYIWTGICYFIASYIVVGAWGMFIDNMSLSQISYWGGIIFMGNIAVKIGAETIYEHLEEQGYTKDNVKKDENIN